ncbi:hypothetical protein PIB30_004228, partial [Stylosanthes scabra]|nr:hypothetical protein [Stylosanthes scabra]
HFEAFESPQLHTGSDMSAMKFDAIEPNAKRARNNNGSVSKRVEVDDEDRFSDLPDCVLIHLLAFLTTKDAVRTTILSTRWKDLWKQVPSLTLHSVDSEFRDMTFFKKFVNKVLSFRCGSVPLHSLDFCYGGRIPTKLLTRVVKYAVSHKIEQLRLNIYSVIELPPCLFSSKTVTSLDLLVPNGEAFGLLPKSLNMTALMSLRLRRFAFPAGDGELVEPFSRSLTVSSSTLELLSKIPDLVNTESPCLDNLKSLIVKVHKFRQPVKLHRAEQQLPLIDGVVDYLTRKAPFPEVTIVDD